MVRILVVDDDDLVRETIVRALQDARYRVSEASNGQDALEILDGESFDLVISDILMPEVDGIGLVLALRKRRQAMRVICISGGDRTGNADFLDMAGKLGAHAILGKPFTPAQLLAAVEEVMSRPVSTRA